MHPEMRYKLCKFCENRARDTPLQGVYIPHFGQIWVKMSILGVPHPCRCTDGGEIWHGEGDSMRGEKPQNRPLSKLNTGRFALRAMLPVKSENALRNRWLELQEHLQNITIYIQSVISRHWKTSFIDRTFLKFLNCTQYKCTTNNQHKHHTYITSKAMKLNINTLFSLCQLPQRSCFRKDAGRKSRDQLGNPGTTGKWPLKCCVSALIRWCVWPVFTNSTVLQPLHRTTCISQHLS